MNATVVELFARFILYRKENMLKHCQDAYPEIASHSGNCKEDSKIFEILESKNLKVNSYHHQALKK